MAVKKLSFANVDEYIASQPVSVRAELKKLREAIKKSAPKAEEIISYQMPAYKFNGMLVWFAAYKNHYGFYPYSKTIEVFKNKLRGYELSKGTVKFPLDRPLPLKLIMEMVKYKVKENTNKELLKKRKKVRTPRK